MRSFPVILTSITFWPRHDPATRRCSVKLSIRRTCSHTFSYVRFRARPKAWPSLSSSLPESPSRMVESSGTTDRLAASQLPSVRTSLCRAVNRLTRLLLSTARQVHPAGRTKEKSRDRSPGSETESTLCSELGARPAQNLKVLVSVHVKVSGIRPTAMVPSGWTVIGMSSFLVVMLRRLSWMCQSIFSVSLRL